MSTTIQSEYKNLTLAQVRELGKKYKFFKVIVQSNPEGEGGEQELFATIDSNANIDTCRLGQQDINGVNYAWCSGWKDYKGTFDFIPLYTKEEADAIKSTPFEVGDLAVIDIGNSSCLFFTLRGFGYKNGDIVTIIKELNERLDGSTYRIRKDSLPVLLCSPEYLKPYFKSSSTININGKDYTVEELSKLLK